MKEIMTDNNQEQKTDNEEQKTEEPKKEAHVVEKPKNPKTSEKPEAVEQKKQPEKKKEAQKPEVAEKTEKKPEPKKSKKEVKVSAKLGKIITEIEKLTVLELADMVKALEEKFGVSGVPMTTPTAGVTGPAATAEKPGEEQTIFNVVLAQTGNQKIQVIKALRQIKPTLGLQEAKKISESAPEEILNQVNKKEAEEAKQKLEAAGATVELK